MIGDNISNAVLFNYTPSGASLQTANSDGLSSPGVDSSKKMAMKDEQRVLEIKDRFESIGKNFNFPPALLAAISSRESRCGSVLDDTGWGDLGHAFGIMQIDKRSHSILGQPDPSCIEHLSQAAGIIEDYLDQIMQIHPTWPNERQLQGAVAAYNVGVKNIQTLDGMDKGTTHYDYSNDIWSRALYFAGK